MQYSTLRISTLAMVFSASTALAFLDCGGGRAPPKTTVPGCPGYVDPTAVASSTSTSSIGSAIAAFATGSSSWSSDTDYSDSDFISTKYTGDNDGLCICSGYVCEFVEPGCVEVDTDTGARSTITANPGWQTKSFDPEEYLSYIATAGAGMVYSSDGYVVSFDFPATELTSLTQYSTSTSKYATGTIGVTAGTPTGTTSPKITSTSSSANATAASTLSTITSVTASSNTTAPIASQTVQTASKNGAPKTVFSSLAALLVFGAGAVAFL